MKTHTMSANEIYSIQFIKQLWHAQKDKIIFHLIALTVLGLIPFFGFFIQVTYVLYLAYRALWNVHQLPSLSTIDWHACVRIGLQSIVLLIALGIFVAMVWFMYAVFVLSGIKFIYIIYVLVSPFAWLVLLYGSMYQKFSAYLKISNMWRIFSYENSFKWKMYMLCMVSALFIVSNEPTTYIFFQNIFRPLTSFVSSVAMLVSSYSCAAFLASSLPSQWGNFKQGIQLSNQNISHNETPSPASDELSRAAKEETSTDNRENLKDTAHSDQDDIIGIRPFPIESFEKYRDNDSN